MVDAVKEKYNERRKSRNWWVMMESTNSCSHQTCELVAFHKVKCIFINLKDLETEDPDQLVICEFKGKDFELVA